MRKIKIDTDWRHWKTEQISGRIFYLLIALTAVLFLLFRFVGYDIPYDENPDYNAPLFTGLLIGFMLLLTLATVGLAVWGAVRGLRKNRGENVVVNNVPARRITLYVVGGTIMLLVLTFALSSTESLTVNGAPFTDAFWLRAAGMFIGTSLLLIVIAIGAVVFGATRYIR